MLFLLRRTLEGEMMVLLEILYSLFLCSYVFYSILYNNGGGTGGESEARNAHARPSRLHHTLTPYAVPRASSLSIRKQIYKAITLN